MLLGGAVVLLRLLATCAFICMSFFNRFAHSRLMDEVVIKGVLYLIGFTAVGIAKGTVRCFRVH